MKNPPSPIDFLDGYAPYLINQVANEWNYEFKKVLKAQGLINLSQWRVMAVIHARSELSLTDLTRHVTMDQPTVSRIVEKLVEQELVCRIQHPEDRRFLSLTLTQRGVDIVNGFWPLVLQFYEQATSALTEQEVGELVVLLRKAASGFKGTPPASQDSPY
ncbi:hypothetical protein BH09PSE5_BH09PSE5_25880 [soil metagenome]